MQQMIDAAKEYIRELFAENADGHGLEHALRVYRSAILIAETEPGADKQIVALGALLHDADDHKLFHTENNANARRFLEAQGVGRETANRICEAINAVSFSQNKGKRPGPLKDRSSRMRTGWMPSARWALPAPLPMAESTAGRRKVPYPTSMRSSSCSGT